MVRKSVAANSPYFGDYTRNYWYMEHTAHQGLVLPAFIERDDGTFVTTFRIESVDVNPPLDDALFPSPAE